mgnify:CR=1 FL=1
MLVPPARRDRRRAAEVARLGQDLLCHFGLLHSGEAMIEALVFHGEFFVVQAEAVEDGGLEVVYVDGVAGDVVAQLVCRADDVSRLYAPAGQPHGKRKRMMIAAGVGLAVAAAIFAQWRAAELGGLLRIETRSVGTDAGYGPRRSRFRHHLLLPASGEHPRTPSR